MELILISYAADFIFGDPRWFPHPVRLMGGLISLFDRLLNGGGRKSIQRFCGAAAAFGVIAISGLCAYVIIETARGLHPLLGKIAWVLLAYTTLATRDLVEHARAVQKMLAINNLGEARKKISLMVGRDTQGLSKEGVICATVETVAENITDGIVAPLFYLFIGGPVVAVMFKAVSTLDSMIGHKSDRYIHFGWCAARLDDAANYIPARISGVLIPLAALLVGKDVRGAFLTMLRDGRKQDSPNSAVSEAAMAGALGVRLGGTCRYPDRIVEHPYLGEQRRPIALSLVKEAITIGITTSFLMLMAGILLMQTIVHLAHP